MPASFFLFSLKPQGSRFAVTGKLYPEPYTSDEVHISVRVSET